MQQVSYEYQQSMKSPLRERGYISVSFGVVNQEAQKNATIAAGDYLDYSSVDTLFKDGVQKSTYATLEEDFTPVDGSMIFLPRIGSGDLPQDTGLIGASLISDGEFEVIIDLNVLPTDIKGLTLDFGENYPIDFDVIGSVTQTLEVRGNTNSIYNTEEVFEGVTQLRIVVYSMRSPNSRVRIYSITFGYGIVRYNEDVLSSSLESYVSPIGADVPQIDFTVKLTNYDRYFDVDNPTSAINFFETGQEMVISYGYATPGKGIEWIKGQTLLCSEWESDDSSVTIRCLDVFRNMDREYYKGVVRSTPISYYDLAELVLDDAGITNYAIDPWLHTVVTKNPLPRVSHKEALQIIANACRCILSQTRDGKIQIRSSYVPDMTSFDDSDNSTSSTTRVFSGVPNEEYCSLATNYMTVDGEMIFPERSTPPLNYIGGFISEELSDGNGDFQTNPWALASFDGYRVIEDVVITLGQALPKQIIVTLEGEGGDWVYQHQPIATSQLTIPIHLSNPPVAQSVKLEFVGTQEAHNRIVVQNVEFRDNVDFTMEKNDMTSSPKAIKQEKVKSVVVPYYKYQTTSAEESLFSEDIETTVANDVLTFFFDEPSYSYRAALEGVTGGVTVVESGAYYVSVRITNIGSYHLEIFGRIYKVVEQTVRSTLSERGKEVKWENPLIDNSTDANKLTEWLSDYYEYDVEYEYNTRGNPELDVNDVIYQENDFVTEMPVRLYRQTLNFNGAFSGKVTTRKMGGV